MEILSVILTVLEIIGIVLLVIIGVLIFIILFLLFGGIRYNINAEKKEDISIDVKVSFVGILKFVFLFSDNTINRYFKFLCFKFFKYNSDDFKLNEEKSDDIEKNNDTKENDTIIKYDELSKTDSEKDDFNSEKKEFSEDLSEDKFLKKDFEKENIGENKLNNFFSAVKNIYNNFISIKNYSDKDKIIKYTFELIKKLFFALKPKKFYADVLIGFEDPYETGKFIGLMSIIFEFLPLDVYFVGDFENKVFEGSLKVKGKTNLFKVGFPILRFVFKDAIWKFIRNRKG